MADYNEYAEKARQALLDLQEESITVWGDAPLRLVMTIKSAIDALEATCTLMLQGLQQRDRTIRELREELEAERARFARLKARHRTTLANLE